MINMHAVPGYLIGSFPLIFKGGRVFWCCKLRRSQALKYQCLILVAFLSQARDLLVLGLHSCAPYLPNQSPKQKTEEGKQQDQNQDESSVFGLNPIQEFQPSGLAWRCSSSHANCGLFWLSHLLPYCLQQVAIRAGNAAARRWLAPYAGCLLTSLPNHTRSGTEAVPLRDKTHLGR